MSNRRNKFKTDVESAINLFDGSILTDIEPDYESESVSFCIKGQNFTLQTYNYPKDCMLFCDTGAEPVSGTVIEVLNNLVRKWDKSGTTLPPLSTSSSTGPNVFNSSITSNLSVESDSQSWLNASADFDDFAESSQANERWRDSAALVSDIEAFASVHGSKSMVVRPIPLLEKVEIELIVHVSGHLSSLTASAWGIDPLLPVVVKLSVDELYTLSKSPPSVAVFQLHPSDPGQKSMRPFKLQFQLESVVKHFVRSQWRKVQSSMAIHQPGSSAPAPAPKAAPDVIVVSDDEPEAGDDFVLMEGTCDADPLHDGLVGQLVEMGFTAKKSSAALRLSNDSLPAALTLLTEQEDVIEEEMIAHETGGNGKRPSSEISAPGGPPPSSSSKRTVPQKRTIHGKIDKLVDVEDIGDGFFGRCLRYLIQRLPRLNEFCVICDQRHVFVTGNMLKPCVCSRPLCCYSWQTLGVASQCADEIATDGEIVDLLVCICRVAARSPRNNVIFDPYPLIFDPKDKQRKILDPKAKNFNTLNAILDKFPSIQAMNSSRDYGHMKEQLDRAHPHAYDLLQFIITSNRSHLVKISTDNIVKAMATEHQYLMLSATPEHEARFGALKQKHGTIFAFHGSSAENWHSILRQGLKNASGTRLQMNGAAHGKGIYVSPAAATSFGYCRATVAAQKGSAVASTTSGGAQNRFLSTTNVVLIAICEVINSNIRKSGDIWVIPDEAHVVTRFLFAYSSGYSALASASRTDRGELPKQLQKAMDFYLN